MFSSYFSFQTDRVVKAFEVSRKEPKQIIEITLLGEIYIQNGFFRISIGYISKNRPPGGNFTTHRFSEVEITVLTIFRSAQRPF